LVFHEVKADLEAEGYEVQPYVLPAVSVNAPHRRDRVWFVAHARNSKYSGNTREVSRKTNEEDGRWIEHSTTSEQQVQLPIESSSLFGVAAHSKSARTRQDIGGLWSVYNRHSDGVQDTADTNKSRPETFNNKESILGEKDRTKTFSGNSTESIHTRKWWESFPSVSPICTGDDGIPDRLDSITFPKWRNESIKAGGNAIVPQVVYQIFKTIEQYENLH
jgi:DNA (cytosine-5)-methyltransferase 1